MRRKSSPIAGHISLGGRGMRLGREGGTRLREEGSAFGGRRARMEEGEGVW